MELLPTLRGAFCLTFMDEHTLYAARDPHGVRPLCLGRLDRGWVVASETAALDIVGASFVREIEPGELLAIDADGVRSSRFADADAQGLRFRVRLPGPPGQRHRRPFGARHPRRDRSPARQGTPDRRRPGHPRPRVRHPGRGRLRAGFRHSLRPGPDEERLRRPHLHPAVADHPSARHPAQAQPAQRGHPRQAPDRRGRLDRPRQHPARADPDAPRGGRAGDPRADRLAAGQVALLLRHRLRLTARS